MTATVTDQGQCVALTAKDFLNDVTPIHNWHQWLEMAAQATSFEQKLGLLHVGFDVDLSGRSYAKDLGGGYITMVSETDCVPLDRVKFYLAVADGWTHGNTFRNEGEFWEDEPIYRVMHPDGRRDRERRSELRRRLAKKAFEAVAMRHIRYFNANVPSLTERHPDYTGFLQDSGLDLLIDFFRPHGDTVRNLSESSIEKKSPAEKEMLEFLCNVPNVLWNWKAANARGGGEKRTARIEASNREIGALVRRAKVWIVEVLYVLDELDRLDPWWLQLDRNCRAKLEELALRSKFNYMDYKRELGCDGPAKTLDEALLLNSPAAVLLNRIRIGRNTRAKHLRNRRLEHKRALLAEQIQQLEAKKN